MAITRPLAPGLSAASTTSTRSPRRNGPTVKISTAQNRLDSTLHTAKKATAATATKPENAAHSTPADTPRCSSASSSALPMISQRRAPRSGSSSSPGSCW
ncbi:hypothetical protein D3C81_1904920 [compost metagenome]